ncbi:MAG: HEAT repeat domain-containing protein [Bacteroidota bacterium]
MNLQLLIVVSLTVAVTFFVVVASVALVVHKYVNGRIVRARQRLYGYYSDIMADKLLCELPPLPERARTSALFRQYEDLVRPIKERLQPGMTGSLTLHREALRLVLIDCAKDITGETSDRLTYFFYSFGFVEEQISLLSDSRWWVRAQSANDMAQLKARKAIAPLTAALRDEHADVRNQAMQSLIVLIGVNGLGAIFRSSRNLSLWTEIELSNIVMRFREEAVPFLVEGLDSTDQSVVLFCIEMLAEIGFVSAVDPLRTMARDYPNTLVRAKAVEALGRLGDERAEELLLLLTHNPFPPLRLKALEALGRIGSPSAVPVLAGCIREGAADVRLTAARSLAASGEVGRSMLMSLAMEAEGIYRPVIEQVLEEFDLEPIAG